MINFILLDIFPNNPQPTHNHNMNTELTIPAAFYDSLYEKGISVPQEQEIRHKGKGKQYLIDTKDPYFPTLLGYARTHHGVVVGRTAMHAAATNLITSLEKQGFDTGEVIIKREPKAVTRKTNAIGDRRNLIVTITPEGDLILRPAGRRKSVSISLSAVYSLAVNAEARQAIRAQQKARKEKRMARRAERDAAVLAFKANPTSITL
jgi:hypothetical protein